MDTNALAGKLFKAGCRLLILCAVCAAALLACETSEGEQTENPTSTPAPIATPTPTPESMPTAETNPDLPWWDMTPEEYREINARTEQWSMDALGFPPGFDTQPELRANACRIWAQLGYDFNRLEEFGSAQVAQGVSTAAEVEVVDTILGMMHGALVNQYMDSYMDARKAGHTQVTPAEAIVPAYCALRPLLDAE